MEDGATIGQWNNREKMPSELEDSVKGSVPSPRGSSVGFLTPTPDGTQSANMAVPKRPSDPNKSNSRNSKDKNVQKLPLILNKRDKVNSPPVGPAAPAAPAAATTPTTTTTTTTTTTKTTTNTTVPVAAAAATSTHTAATGGATAAAKPRGKSQSRKPRKVSTSRSSTPGRRGKRPSPASSRPSSSSKSPQKRRASRSASTSRSRGGSRSSSAASSRRVSGRGRPRSGGRKGSAKGRKSLKGRKGTRKGSVSSRRSTKGAGDATALYTLAAAEEAARSVLMEEEEKGRDALLPDYHLLVMHVVRTQVREVNRRQQQLNDAFKALQAHGIQLSSGQDPNAALEAMRAKMQADAQRQMEELRVENATLRGLLEEKKVELEEKVTEAQSLRDKISRRLMRFEVENESLKAEVQAALQTNQLDVDRMKRELAHRLDVATASLRTPKYDTALRSMQELAQSVQEEIQEHHDVLSKLIVSIAAQDTFLRDRSDSMHSNFPTRYRDELRKLDKDHLLNVLDVLSFHDTVVETVGKALYVLQKSEHSTNVF
ncbi:uncharacterized protein TM35_000063960 [Trypanosoma theileri]|uniref:Uncharacterized protein n=1 Tax=Trypanosoma theileri TaxID=67003 RepID=A0A1X0P3G3_9TRYP|nr:uncharacterized protein TM35_000063960 [Trypanosoma theileri]ORC91391.1 hypothetical protein TM35_000063960 [Trypanosoma theileri]